MGLILLETAALVAGVAVIGLAFLMLEPESEGRLFEGALRRLRAERETDEHGGDEAA